MLAYCVLNFYRSHSCHFIWLVLDVSSLFNECIQLSSSVSVDNFLFDDSSTTATQRTESQRNWNVSEIVSSNLTAMPCHAM
jgi:hypothetical protein